MGRHWIAGQAMVSKLRLARIGLIMAAASLMMGLTWQAMALPTTTPGSWPLRFYQHVLGHLDGRNCSSYPVCSAYASQALTKHGMVMGSMLIIDRLIHEADDLQRGPWIVADGKTRLYDPLARNDFWLKGDR